MINIICTVCNDITYQALGIFPNCLQKTILGLNMDM